MITFDDFAGEKKLNIIQNGHIFDHPYRILIIGDSGSPKTNHCLI